MNVKKVLIGGGGGFVGRSLGAYLSRNGYEVAYLSRNPHSENIFWDLESEFLSPEKISAFDAVISLAGENIFSRWTRKKKEEILSSRVNSARTISKAISNAKTPPKVFICASAVGYYGNNLAHWVDESSSSGKDFLAMVCKEWEKASQFKDMPNTRVVNTRFGIIIGKDGGFFKTMESISRFGIIPIFSSGEQKMSWISIDDVCRAFKLVLEDSTICGAVNFTAPIPCSNRDFADSIKSFRKFGIEIKIPKFLLRLAMGKSAESLALSNISAFPRKLLDSGFAFTHTNISSVVSSLISKKAQK